MKTYIYRFLYKDAEYLHYHILNGYGCENQLHAEKFLSTHLSQFNPRYRPGRWMFKFASFDCKPPEVITLKKGVKWGF